MAATRPSMSLTLLCYFQNTGRIFPKQQAALCRQNCVNSLQDNTEMRPRRRTAITLRGPTIYQTPKLSLNEKPRLKSIPLQQLLCFLMMEWVEKIHLMPHNCTTKHLKLHLNSIIVCVHVRDIFLLSQVNANRILWTEIIPILKQNQSSVSAVGGMRFPICPRWNKILDCCGKKTLRWVVFLVHFFDTELQIWLKSVISLCCQTPVSFHENCRRVAHQGETIARYSCGTKKLSFFPKIREIVSTSSRTFPTGTLYSYLCCATGRSTVFLSPSSPCSPPFPSAPFRPLFTSLSFALQCKGGSGTMSCRYRSQNNFSALLFESWQSKNQAEHFPRVPEAIVDTQTQKASNSNFHKRQIRIFGQHNTTGSLTSINAAFLAEQNSSRLNGFGAAFIWAWTFVVFRNFLWTRT